MESIKVLLFTLRLKIMINTNIIPTFNNNISFPNILNKNIPYETNNDCIYDCLTNKTKEKQSGEINRAYKNYKNLSNYSKIHQRLNKIKIYFLTKSNEIEGKTTVTIIPINTLDDLSNSTYVKALMSRIGIFQMRTKLNKKDRKVIEGTPGNQPFILGHTTECVGSFNGISNISLEDLRIIEEFELDNLSHKKIKGLHESKLKVHTQFIVDQNGVEKTINYYVYQDQYEYDYVFLDNTIFTNVELYCTDPRNRENFRKTFTDRLENLKNFNLNTFISRERKTLLILESADIFYKNTDELLNKNIIPIFSNFEDVQDLFITIFEEILEPYKKYDFSKQDKSNLITNINYIDDSFNFKNREISYNTIKKRLKGWLLKYRIIESNIALQQYYQIKNNKFNQNYSTKSLKKNSYLYDEIYINDFDEVLFNTMNNMKIASMGLGDFLYFLNNKDIKNGEVLFIPSLKKLEKKQSSLLPLIQKKYRDQFYEYQKEFRNKSADYMYEIV